MNDKCFHTCLYIQIVFCPRFPVYKQHNRKRKRAHNQLGSHLSAACLRVDSGFLAADTGPPSTSDIQDWPDAPLLVRPKALPYQTCSNLTRGAVQINTGRHRPFTSLSSPVEEASILSILSSVFLTAQAITDLMA